MLNYVITIAISVIFVPHYLSIFWEPLRTNPWDIVVGIALTWMLVGHQHHRHPGGGAAQHLPRGRRLRDAAAARRARLRPDLQPARPAGRTSTSAIAPTWSAFLLAIPVGDDRLHRDRDRLEPRRGGARPGAHDPALDLVGRDRRLRDLLHAAVDRALGDAGRRTRAGTYVTQLGQNPPHGFKNDPVLGLVENLGLHGAVLSRGQGLRRHPRRDDPLHRDERRRDRRIADHLLDVDATGSCPRCSAGCTRS